MKFDIEFDPQCSPKIDALNLVYSLKVEIDLTYSGLDASTSYALYGDNDERIALIDLSPEDQKALELKVDEACERNSGEAFDEYLQAKSEHYDKYQGY